MNPVELKPVDKHAVRSRLWAGSNGIIYQLLRDNTFKAFCPIERHDGTYIWLTNYRGRKGRYKLIAELVLDAFKSRGGGYLHLYKDGDIHNNVPSNLYRGDHTAREADRLFHAENGIGNVRPEVVAK